ncbi:reverse transcriptase domain-containing protein [Tanacetum coccineum]
MSTSSSTQAVSSDVAELKDMVRALILDRKNQTPASAPVKAVEQSCAAAANFNQANSGYRPPMVSNQIRPPGFPPIQNPHSQNNFNRGNNFNQNRGNNFNQGQIYRPPVHQPVAHQPVAHQGPAPQTHGVSKTDFERYVTANDAVLRNMQNQVKTCNTKWKFDDMLSKFVVSTDTLQLLLPVLEYSSGNTVTNPKEDLKVSLTEVVLPSRTKKLIMMRGDKGHGAAANKPEAQKRPTSSVSVLISQNDFPPLNKSSTKLPRKLGDNGISDSMLNLRGITTSNALAIFASDRSFTEPIGIAKDVRLMVGKFQFPADFVVVDFEPDPRVPLILGRCFLKTKVMLVIDVYEGGLPSCWQGSHHINLDQTSKYTAGLQPYDGKTKSTVIDMAIPIDPKDQEKTTFTCPYGTFAYRRMPFGLCNAPGTFQRCMMAIFHDMIEKTMEVFMDDFSVFGDSFSTCLSHLEKMLKRCEDTNLSLNWEKSHFMVKEGIVLGHKISKSGIEVDRAKVEVIAKLPHPTTVKGVRSFLGHAGFYRRFIQDFSKIARPMTHLLEKETPFFFSEECIDSFNTLKRKLTEAPILIAPDWDLPFELSNVRASDKQLGQSRAKKKQAFSTYTLC